ncbi:MAG: creatininase family protein [Gemmatimonadota bacterium]
MRTEPQTQTSGPTRLDELTSGQVADWFRRDPRLLLPVGSCTQHGPCLPVGTDNRITEELARAVCSRTEILLAPLLPFGVASREDLEQAGTAGLERKTLHRVLNELVESWERQGLEEVTLLTGNGNVRHIQALAMVLTKSVRVRSVDTRAIDVSRFLDSGESEHVDEFEASLMLHMAPDTVRRTAVEGSFPTAATELKGRRIYEYLVDSIVERLGA